MSSGSSQAAISEYETRRVTRRAAAERAMSRERVFGAARLVVFLAGIWVVWVSLVDRAISPLILLLPSAVFVWLIVWHNRVIARRRRLERAESFYIDGLARIDGRWRSADDGVPFVRDDHVFAFDLDIVGTDGLVSRLSTARTARGREMLVDWLTTPASIAVARERQTATRELRDRLDLREELAVLGEEAATHIHGDSLVAWGQAPRAFSHRLGRVAAILSSAFTTSALVALALGSWPLVAPFALVAHTAVAYALRRPVKATLRGVDGPARELSLLAGFTDRLGRERFAAERLMALADELRRDGTPATEEIRHLAHLTELLDSVRNQLFAPIALLLHWHIHVAHAIDAWRAAHGGKIAKWIDTIGEMEALSVIAGYAYEHPDDAYPEIVDEPGVDARAIGHPFLPPDVCVTNDVRLDTRAPLLVVSGSNMSGKSTLLRSVGVNAALALAGAPVRAARFRLSPVSLGASLRIADSLQDGRSRFLVEVERLKALVDISRGDTPLLFLVDELLQGTNSHDRRIGAEAVMRTLIANGAFGILTTHDLALTEIAESLDAARNAHFQDHMEDGKMAFDYTLRPGIVTKSNAVALMRQVGLDV